MTNGDDPVTVRDLGSPDGHSTRYGRAPDGDGIVLWLAVFVLLLVVIHS